MIFDVDGIVAKIPAVEAYKMRHFYDNMSLHRFDVREAPVEAFVTDYAGRSGKISLERLGRISGFEGSGLKKMIKQIYEERGEGIGFDIALSKYLVESELYKKIKHSFKDIKFYIEEIVK